MALKANLTIEPSALPGLSLTDVLSSAELHSLEAKLERSAELHVILRVAKSDNTRSKRIIGN